MNLKGAHMASWLVVASGIAFACGFEQNETEHPPPGAEALEAAATKQDQECDYPGECIHVEGTAPQSPWQFGQTSGGSGAGAGTSGGTSSGGGSVGTGGGTPPPRDDEKGPTIDRLEEAGFQCQVKTAPAWLVICDKCSDDTGPGGTRACTCYDCNKHSRRCKPGYDCTAWFPR